MRAGATSHNAIAAKLNERNVRTARGGAWTHVQVGAILHPFRRRERRRSITAKQSRRQQVFTQAGRKLHGWRQ
jgi:Recombinase